MGEFFPPVEFAENMCCEIRDIKALWKEGGKNFLRTLRSSLKERWEFMLSMAECHEFLSTMRVQPVQPHKRRAQALNRHGLS
jgi:hypothetical protein